MAMIEPFDPDPAIDPDPDPAIDPDPPRRSRRTSAKSAYVEVAPKRLSTFSGHGIRSSVGVP